MDIEDFKPRIRELRERQERLECSAEEARAALAQRRKVLDDVNAVAAYAREMKDFLEESELTERRAFIETFVKEILVVPGDALMRYSAPMPDDSLIPRKATETVALPDSVLSTVQVGGPGWTLTNDLGLIRTAAFSLLFLRRSTLVGLKSSLNASLKPEPLLCSPTSRRFL